MTSISRSWRTSPKDARRTVQDCHQLLSVVNGFPSAYSMHRKVHGQCFVQTTAVNLLILDMKYPLGYGLYSSLFLG